MEQVHKFEQFESRKAFTEQVNEEGDSEEAEKGDLGKYWGLGIEFGRRVHPDFKIIRIAKVIL